MACSTARTSAPKPPNHDNPRPSFQPRPHIRIRAHAPPPKVRAHAHIFPGVTPTATTPYLPAPPVPVRTNWAQPSLIESTQCAPVRSPAFRRKVHAPMNNPPFLSNPSNQPIAPGSPGVTAHQRTPLLPQKAPSLTPLPSPQPTQQPPQTPNAAPHTKMSTFKEISSKTPLFFPRRPNFSPKITPLAPPPQPGDGPPTRGRDYPHGRPSV